MNVIEFPCPIPTCDVFPYESSESLTAHILTHAAAAATAATVGTLPINRWSRTAIVETDQVPSGSASTTKRGSHVGSAAPECRWKKVDGKWIVRGPLSVLESASSVEVVKANGDRQIVEVDPATVATSSRTNWDNVNMATVHPASRKAATQKLPENTDPPKGIHLVDGTIYKVQASKTGNLYAKVLDTENQIWEYVGRKPFRHLSEATLATLEGLEKFGQAHGICGICGRTLTNPDSIERGIGPICASRF